MAGVPPPLIHPCFRPPSSSSFFSGILNSPQTLSILNSCPPITQIFAQPTCTQPPPSSRPSLGHCDSRNFQIPMPAFIHPSRGSSSGSLKLLLHLPTPPSQSPPLPPPSLPHDLSLPQNPPSATLELTPNPFLSLISVPSPLLYSRNCPDIPTSSPPHPQSHPPQPPLSLQRPLPAPRPGRPAPLPGRLPRPARVPRPPPRGGPETQFAAAKHWSPGNRPRPPRGGPSEPCRARAGWRQGGGARTGARGPRPQRPAGRRRPGDTQPATRTWRFGGAPSKKLGEIRGGRSHGGGLGLSDEERPGDTASKDRPPSKHRDSQMNTDNPRPAGTPLRAG